MEDFFVIVAGALLAICAGVKLLTIATYKKNSAICIAVSSRWSHSDGTSSFGYSGTSQYEYDGTEIIANDKSFLDSTKLEVGSKYVLLVNPRIPNVFVKQTEVKYYVFFLLVGLAFVFLAPIVF